MRWAAKQRFDDRRGFETTSNIIAIIFMKQKLKYTLFTLAVLFVVILLLEITARTAIFIYSRDISSFRYGFNDNIKIRSQNRIITFYKIEADTTASQYRNQKDIQSKMSAEVITLAAFGGSTTRGYNCSKNSSSWPEELEIILNKSYDKRFRVINFGADGTNSDYAVEQLLLANADGNVNFVLWANFINESDIIFTGPVKNLEALSKQFPDIINANRSFLNYREKILFHRLDRTLKNHSLFYWGLFKTVQYLKVKFPSKNDGKNIIEHYYQSNKADRFIAMALANYRLNFISAYKYCQDMGIEMILVRLPELKRDKRQNRNTLQVLFMDTFRKKHDRLMQELSKAYQVNLINVNEAYGKYHIPDDVFCDGSHQKYSGHQWTAKFVSKDLQTIVGLKKYESHRARQYFFVMYKTSFF